MNRRIFSFNHLILIFAIGLFAWIFSKNYSAIYEAFHKVGLRFFIFLIPSTLILLFLTVSWNAFLIASKIKISFHKLFQIKVVGEAINNLSPLSWAAGDPLRVQLLKAWIPSSSAMASIVVDRTLASISAVLFMICGAILAMFRFSFPLAIQLGFLIILTVSSIGMFYVYRKQKSGLFESLIRFLQKTKIRKNWSEQSIQNAKETDFLILEFYTTYKRLFWVSCFFQILTRALMVLEIDLTAYLLKVPLNWMDAWLLASLNVLLGLVFVFLPGGVGVSEFAFAEIFKQTHNNAALGLNLQIFRRVRLMIWYVWGFAYWFSLKRQQKKDAAVPLPS